MNFLPAYEQSAALGSPNMVFIEWEYSVFNENIIPSPCSSELYLEYHEAFAFFFHFHKQPQKYQLFIPKFLSCKFCTTNCYPMSVIEVPRSFHLPVVQNSSESVLPSKFMSGKAM